jgi:hypothetical protein
MKGFENYCVSIVLVVHAVAAAVGDMVSVGAATVALEECSRMS